MTRIFLFNLFLLISVSVFSQTNSTYTPLKGNYPDSKRTEVVSNIPWKIGTKGMKSLALSFNNGDTVVYKISRENNRKATFYLLDSNSVLYHKKFKKETNIVSGAFIANGLGTYLFKVKNHSFLNNNFTLDVKKAPFIPVVVPVKKKEDSITITKIEVTVDSVVTKVDSAIYLASTLNFNQSSEFIIPYSIEKEYECYMVLPKDVKLKTFIFQEEKKRSVRQSELKCGTDGERIKGGKDIIIYLTVADGKWSLTDSLATVYIGKDVKYCQTKIVGSKSELRSIVLSNDEKVPGKHFRVLVKEIAKSPKKTIIKVPNDDKK